MWSLILIVTILGGPPVPGVALQTTVIPGFTSSAACSTALAQATGLATKQWQVVGSCLAQ